MAAAKDLMMAVQAQDAKRVAAAFRAAFELLEKQPHEEVEHDEYVESEDQK